MHLEVYRQRPDIRAVVHAHPPIATGFAVAGIPLDRAVLAEVLTTLGSIPIAAYATPSTAELPEAVRKYIKAHDGMLLANHGALTVGSDLFSAYYKMETIEHFATISLVARLLGRENLIAREEVLRLQELRGTYGIAAPAPICADPADGGGSGDASIVGGSAASFVGGSAASSVGGSRDASFVGGSRDASIVGASGDASAGDPPAMCQRVQAPVGGGRRLVPDSPDAVRASAGRNGEDAEIRLTYRQLSALIEDAIRSLR
jgi:hypothetical protein